MQMVLQRIAAVAFAVLALVLIAWGIVLMATSPLPFYLHLVFPPALMTLLSVTTVFVVHALWTDRLR